MNPIRTFMACIYIYIHCTLVYIYIERFYFKELQITRLSVCIRLVVKVADKRRGGHCGTTAWNVEVPRVENPTELSEKETPGEWILGKECHRMSKCQWFSQTTAQKRSYSGKKKIYCATYLAFGQCDAISICMHYKEKRTCHTDARLYTYMHMYVVDVCFYVQYIYIDTYICSLFSSGRSFATIFGVLCVAFCRFQVDEHSLTESPNSVEAFG